MRFWWRRWICPDCGWSVLLKPWEKPHYEPCRMKGALGLIGIAGELDHPSLEDLRESRWLQSEREDRLAEGHDDIEGSE